MVFKPLLLVLSLAAQAFAAAVPKQNDVKQDDVMNQDVEWDAIIVGGGPAGLSALSGLARVRRNVLLIDSGEYRNGPTRHMHDVLGFDGVAPAYFRWAARKAISYYSTAAMTNGTVTNVKNLTPDGSNTTHFTVTSTYLGSDEPKTLKTRKVILATGLRDILPNTEGLEENWGKGIYWCPWCDGHEHADQAMGLLASMEDVASAVSEISTLNTDVVAFVNGTDTPENRALAETKFPNFQTYLELKNVTLYNSTMAAIRRLKEAEHAADPSLPTAPEHDLFEVSFTDGSPPVQRDAMFVDFAEEQHSLVGAEMGVTMLGTRMGSDLSRGMLTNIPGVYAVGDANSDNSTNVPHALFTGKRSAVNLHINLGKEMAQQEIADWKNSHEKREEELYRRVWDTMNGEPDDILHAGDYDNFQF